MSLLGSGTLANADVAYYSGGGGGGGGASTITTSQLTVSSIVGGAAGQMTLDAVSGTFVAGSGLYLTSGGATISFQNNDGEIAGAQAITGVSSINGAVYPPAGGATTLSTTATSGQAVGSVIANISGTIPTTGGEFYLATLVVDGLTQIIGQPNDGDHCSILAGTEVLGTIDCARFSTMYAKGNPRGFAVCGPVKAPGAALQFYGLMNPAAGCSTNIVVSNSVAYFTPL